MTTDKTPATLAVDVLAVMRQCANVATCNSQRYGGPTLKKHAEEANEAIAAVAELIQITSEFDDYVAVDGNATPLLLRYDMWDRLSAALARVKGESA